MHASTSQHAGPPDDGDLIHTVTGPSFKQVVLQGKGPIVVEFMSYGCEHCRIIEPVLQQVASNVRRTEQVYRVNIATEPDLAATYAIDGTPTLVMFLDGEEVGRAEGPRPTLSALLTTVTEPFSQ